MLSPISTLEGTIHVVLADAYGDGTVWFALEDSNARRTHVCIDGRKLSPTRNRLFEAARHPSMTDATLVELGADEEAVVVPLISNWLDSAVPEALGLNEYGWGIIRDGLLRLGEPSV